MLIDKDSAEILEFNDKAHKMLGYTQKEFKKLKISDFEVIESKKDIIGHAKKIKNIKNESFETKHRTKPGTILDIHVTSSIVHIRGREYI